MITKDQALTERYFHVAGHCTAHVGPRGGVTHRPEVWRRSGRTQTWKTRPNDFRIPVKWGLKCSDSITQREADMVYTEAECPVCTLVYALRNEPDVLRQRLASLDAKP